MFHGTLDIKTLGGAGFASQRTTGESRHWDLRKFDGIVLKIDGSKSDCKRYTLILKDTLLPKNPENGREQSTISWEYDFSLPDGDQGPNFDISFKWSDLKPTYRGKEVKDVERLDTSSVKRISIMMRRYSHRSTYVISSALTALLASSAHRRASLH